MLERTIPLIKKFHTDPDLIKLKGDNSPKFLEFIKDKEKGWYWRAKNEICPLIEKIRPFSEKFPATVKTLETIKSIFFDEPEIFEEEYSNYLPPEPSHLVFSHNDIQETNFLANDQETVILDFEYSCVNYRGADLSGYIDESMIDYSISEAPYFKINYDLFQKF